MVQEAGGQAPRYEAVPEGGGDKPSRYETLMKIALAQPREHKLSSGDKIRGMLPGQAAFTASYKVYASYSRD